MKALKQVAALCIRRTADGKLSVLLVTSRDTGRWIIPKGWPVKQLEPREAAALEAEEEAGVLGRPSARPIGVYTYVKRDQKAARAVNVSVYLLRVRKLHKHWLEMKQRERAWFTVEAAARRVTERELGSLIRSVARTMSLRRKRAAAKRAGNATGPGRRPRSKARLPRTVLEKAAQFS